MTARYRGTHNEGTKEVAAGWLTRWAKELCSTPNKLCRGKVSGALSDEGVFLPCWMCWWACVFVSAVLVGNDLVTIAVNITGCIYCCLEVCVGVTAEVMNAQTVSSYS